MGFKKQVDLPIFVLKVASLHGVLLAVQQGPGDFDQLACLHGQQPSRNGYSPLESGGQVRTLSL